MVFNIQIETASLAFASLSLLISSMSSLVCISLMVYVNIIMASFISGAERTWPTGFEVGITKYDLHINTGLAVFLSIMALAFAFSIILTKGLISKKAHLVKAYFVYGVSTTTFFVLTYLSSIIALGFFNQLSFVILFGCFLYGLVLMMIKKTYLKLATHDTDSDQFCHKKLEEEKSFP